MKPCSICVLCNCHEMKLEFAITLFATSSQIDKEGYMFCHFRFLCLDRLLHEIVGFFETSSRSSESEHH
jgi:hypothetical protein